MTYPHLPPRSFQQAALIVWLALALALVAALAGCGPKFSTPPPVVEVLTPISEPCEVAQVDNSTLPSAHRPATGDIFEDVKTILADRATLRADREKLQAANSDPCP
ncbi:hypothetical protein [Novosphingobium panipatense]|uniref:Lipoprotein n=1 Tax=Novosphingobium panipatense TaxID=428991 RepID=A0ABY1Q5I8_9SPHN|nr:hypothetical protein [Novosphingobium panipatense]SMP58514.1 hypothetical protein SAMN06296065_102485 [Novosphingobium panipatense]